MARKKIARRMRSGSINVRRTGGYHHLAPGKPLQGMPVYERRLERVARVRQAIKAATKEGDMGRVRELKAHLAYAEERLAGTAERNLPRSKARRRAA